MEPTAAQWRQRLTTADLTAVELCQHYLDRLDAAEPLKAVAARNDEAALAAAAAADERIRNGETTPLLGVPITLKDCFDAVGMPARSGSLARKDLPITDATVVRRLKEVGAVVLAKTNMPEIGLSYETDNRVTGRTLHPLDPERTPGGSSGGEGALLGADASVWGIGTDGGGSIRVPSAFCGLFGLRPTARRVPTTGTWPPGHAGPMFDLIAAGPMARTAGDLGPLLRVIAGADLVDPFVAPVPLAAEDAVAGAGLRVGWYIEDGVASPDAQVAAAVCDAAAALADLGATVTQVEPPSIVAKATELFFLATAAGGPGILAALGEDPELHVQLFLDLLQQPPYGPVDDLAGFFAVQEGMFELRATMRQWVRDFDVVLLPVCAGQAPKHGTPPAGLPAEGYLRYEAFNYTHTYSIAGLPAASAPIAVANGLPVGIQIVGQVWREDVVLGVAAALEQAFGGYRLTESCRAAS